MFYEALPLGQWKAHREPEHHGCQCDPWQPTCERPDQGVAQRQISDELQLDREQRDDTARDDTEYDKSSQNGMMRKDRSHVSGGEEGDGLRACQAFCRLGLLLVVGGLDAGLRFACLHGCRKAAHLLIRSCG